MQLILFVIFLGLCEYSGARPNSLSSYALSYSLFSSGCIYLSSCALSWTTYVLSGDQPSSSLSYKILNFQLTSFSVNPSYAASYLKSKCICFTSAQYYLQFINAYLSDSVLRSDLPSFWKQSFMASSINSLNRDIVFQTSSVYFSGRLFSQSVQQLFKLLNTFGNKSYAINYYFSSGYQLLEIMRSSTFSYSFQVLTSK
ncbi:Hypothetical_protein [Hexamita inflata]|uniref:Hypothetical_protein n=1 Tax=Hexamita inflata TaxID=28002 RepID=A0ABP1JIA6_9EUKA